MKNTIVINTFTMFAIDSNGPVAIRIYGQQNVLNKDFSITVPPGSVIEIHFCEPLNSQSMVDCEVNVEYDSKIDRIDAPLKSPRENDSIGRKMSSKKYARIKKQLDDDIDAYNAR